MRTRYQSDFSWAEVPVFDGSGLSRARERGVTAVRGLYFQDCHGGLHLAPGRFSGIASTPNSSPAIAIQYCGQKKASHP
ncbi:MAG: hypothetical protein EDM05_000525 [Leptolyngbya sp. IPPAS B-1204]